MIFFKDDYSEGAHPAILDALIKTNMEPLNGYGEDLYTISATRLIQKEINAKSKIFLLPAGTQTNMLAISSFLRPHQAVIAAESAHINVHETGAIEQTGHKILTVPTLDGKLTPNKIVDVLRIHVDEHMVQPKLVCISNPTELGTVYTKEELTALYQLCQKHKLYLYLDGARIGNALMTETANITLEDININTDAFYIGGTKNGALLGEALVISNEALQEDMRFLMKTRGALLAKGRVLGVQFQTLFQNNLYFDNAEKANRGAQKIKTALDELNISFFVDSPTNQIFPILPNTVIQELEKEFAFYIWQSVSDTHSVIRLVTSWATEDSDIDKLIYQCKKLLK